MRTLISLMRKKQVEIMLAKTEFIVKRAQENGDPFMDKSPKAFHFSRNNRKDSYRFVLKIDLSLKKC